VKRGGVGRSLATVKPQQISMLSHAHFERGDFELLRGRRDVCRGFLSEFSTAAPLEYFSLREVGGIAAHPSMLALYFATIGTTPWVRTTFVAT
jgi:hypothetical protein